MVSQENPVFKKIEETAKKLGWKLLKVKKASHNPADRHLFYTLIERKNQYAKDGIDYATHHYNSDFDSFNWGHYDIENFETASKDFNERGN